ncbi:MAG TPA: hypothetical protein HA252_04550 [Candidatus Diapherotrites archaeon]|uniref:Uncharacterized protein n=1 Tax=Candidatus Iainarchaeum sp. TaxID=3101447 RepID=A0A7J4JL54_9ARCH|nr:hypothetical protein [Candidatus Diapherotrites archaeon]HIH16647.1 hypothetical protein [Candidatus Diapherotrites archaeon]
MKAHQIVLVLAAFLLLAYAHFVLTPTEPGASYKAVSLNPKKTTLERCQGPGPECNLVEVEVKKSSSGRERPAG